MRAIAGRTGENIWYCTDANRMARQQLITHCINFPGKYIPQPSSPTTEIVCRLTQSPPRPRNAEQRINLNLSDSTDIRPIQPFASSNIPAIVICQFSGSSHKNHRSKNMMITRNIITQPHTLNIVLMAWTIAHDSEILSEICARIFSDTFWGRR